jgi:hypothetical protein
MNYQFDAFSLVENINELANKVFRQMRGRILGLAIPTFTMLLAGCIIGGTGTDTENGVKDKNVNSMNEAPAGTTVIQAHVVDTTGKPIPGVLLTAIGIYYRPDSMNSIASEILRSTDTKQKEVVSDSKGAAAFLAAGPGTFVVEGSKEGRSLFFDTLKIGDAKALVNITYTASRLRAFQGRVNLASGMHIDSGKVFIRGTRRSVKIDSQGNYNLGILPVNIDRMGFGVRFVASPTAVLEVKATVVKRDTLIDKPVTGINGMDSLKRVYSCRELPADSALKVAKPPRATALDSALADSLIMTGPVLGKLDSIRFNAALKSCDSIPNGALVNVTANDIKLESLDIPDSRSGAFLVPGNSVSTVNLDVSLGQAISYGQCVEAPGVERTSFEIKPSSALTGTFDLAVQDLPSTCIKP